MEKARAKPGRAVGKSGPSKPARKKRRIFLWLFLILFLTIGITVSAFFFRLVPLDPETAEKVEPLIVKMEAYVESLRGGNKTDETNTAGKAKTNFPLVDLDESKKPAPPQPQAPASGILGAPSIASAAPSPSSAGGTGAVRQSPAGKEATDTYRIYGKLAKLYSSMKPEEAVAVFNNLEDEQVVQILSRMDDEAAAKVIATVEPKRAARLTQAMIKRK